MQDAELFLIRAVAILCLINIQKNQVLQMVTACLALSKFKELF